MRCAVVVLLVGFFTAACTHAAEPESRGSSAAASSPSSAHSSSASPSSSGPTTRDPFQPTVLDSPPGGEDRTFFAGEGGIKLAMLNWVGSHPHMSTRYRIYGPGWKPRTPLLQVPSVLEILGPVSGGFLGYAFVLNRDASPRVSKFVLVRPDGTLRTVSVTREKSALLPSDDVLWMQSGRLGAYRPSTGQLRRLRYAETKLPWFASARRTTARPARGVRSLRTRAENRRSTGPSTARTLGNTCRLSRCWGPGWGLRCVSQGVRVAWCWSALTRFAG